MAWMRGLPWSGESPRRGRRRQNKDFHVQERLGERDQQPLPGLPWLRRRAQQLRKVGAPTEQRELHRLSLAPSCEGNRAPDEREAAAALLRMPPRDQAAIQPS